MSTDTYDTPLKGPRIERLSVRGTRMTEERCPKCGKPLAHYEDREVRVRWCGYPDPHHWDWQLKVPRLTMRP